VQVVSFEAPTTPEYFPFPHFKHLDSTQSPSVVEYFPALQSMHMADPSITLYFPETQCVHGPPSGPDDPLLQVQFFKTELFRGESAFVGHCKHVRVPAAKSPAEYCPTSQ
jgi:hypothetical protein